MSAHYRLGYTRGALASAAADLTLASERLCRAVDAHVAGGSDAALRIAARDVARELAERARRIGLVDADCVAAEWAHDRAMESPAAPAAATLSNDGGGASGSGPGSVGEHDEEAAE